MTETKRAPLALRREALLSLAEIVGCEDETKQLIADAPHSMCDTFELAIAAAILATVTR